MDNKYYENVINEIKPFFSENGFIESDGVFSNESKSVTVSYDQARQMYLLNVADIEDGNVGEFREINAWLFDDSQNASDAAAVGIDFTVSLQKEMGIKYRRTSSVTSVELPTASKDGTVNIYSFTKKMLDVFPALKEEYKNYIATYGNFLYLNFYGEYLIPRLVRLFEEGTKKQIKKFYNIIENSYAKGDKDTVNATVIILVAAAYNNDKVTASIEEMLAANPHFLNSFKTIIPFFAKNKKLKNALIKEK